MCWSAQADLAAGLVVSGIGLACLTGARRARRHGRDGLLPLAALPLVLGVHQLVEAAVWLGADGTLPSPLAQAARTSWGLIALPLLPVLVPLGVRRAVTAGAGASPDPARGFVLTLLAVVGIAVALPLTVAVLIDPVTAVEHGHTLTYGVGVPYPAVLLAGYLLATIGPLLCSGDRDLRLLGVLVGIGAAVCAVLWRTAFVSTWCALAALASLVMLRWVRRPPTAGPSGF